MSSVGYAVLLIPLHSYYCGVFSLPSQLISCILSLILSCPPFGFLFHCWLVYFPKKFSETVLEIDYLSWYILECRVRVCMCVHTRVYVYVCVITFYLNNFKISNTVTLNYCAGFSFLSQRGKWFYNSLNICHLYRSTGGIIKNL